MAVQIIPFEFPSVEGVRCAFQCRADALPITDTASHGAMSDCSLAAALAGGNISYVRNDDPKLVRAVRAELAKHLGFLQVAEAQQVHGIVTLFDAQASSQEPEQQLQEADGLATDAIGLALMIKTADCQPVLFAHASGEHIMALHVGWRGNRAHYIQKSVAAWCAAKNIQAQDIFAVRGPSLGPEKARFTKFDEEWGTAYRSYFDTATSTMNLWTLTRDQLVEAGLLERRVYAFDLCTASLPATFFSHRADPLAGRQANFIWRIA